MTKKQFVRRTKRRHRSQDEDERRARPRAGEKHDAPELEGLQHQLGNRAVQRALRDGASPGGGPKVRTGVIQRAPDDQVAAESNTAAAESVGEHEDAWDAIVQTRLEQFLEDFQNIPVTVTWEEDGLQKETIVHVHPPYFINTKKYKRSKERIEAAEAHRKAATGSAEKAPVDTSWFARHGKSTPAEIKDILERAVAAGKVPTPPGKQHPDDDDLRAWLVKYGIGVDCSGFVSQALMEVMGEAYGQAGVAGPIEEIKKGSGGLKGGTADFERISDPADIRAGDTMHTPGHIRIVMGVQSEDDTVTFTTAESTSAKGDVGPNRATWRYDSGTDILYRRAGERWKAYKKTVTYGRYKALATFTAEYVPIEHEAEERRPEQPLDQEEESLLDDIVDGAHAIASGIMKGITTTTDLVEELIREYERRSQEHQDGDTAEGTAAPEPSPEPEEPGRDALTMAIDKGVRNEVELTDLVFHLRHPELGGRAIKKGEETLAQEWITIRNSEVRPALRNAT